MLCNRIGGVMLSVLASNSVDHGIERRSRQTKDYKIDIYRFFDKHTVLRSKIKDWLVQNQEMCSSGATYLPTLDCCFSELELYRSN